MKRLSILLIFLLTATTVYSEEGLELIEVPQGSISKVTSYLEAKIENIGYDRVFVALPQGWQIDPVEQSVKSYAVRESSLWRIYSSPRKNDDLLKKGYIFKPSNYLQTKQSTQINNRIGWWLKPNEGIIINIKLTLPSSGEIDPLKIQKQHPYILVRKWNQEFILDISSSGIIEAPWVVKGATLTTASPAPLGDSGKVKTSSGFYYVESYRDEYERSYSDIPDWDEWLPLQNSLAYAMKPSYNLESFGELTQPEESGDLKPVWCVDTIGEIHYGYEWEQGKVIKGIRLLRDDFKNLPSWFEWFYAY